MDDSFTVLSFYPKLLKTFGFVGGNTVFIFVSPTLFKSQAELSGDWWRDANIGTSQHRSQSQSHRSHDQARMETSQVRRSSDGDQGTRNGDSPNRPFIGHLSPMLCSHWLKMNLWPSLMAALDGSGAREHCSVGHCWQRDSCSSALDCSLSGQEEASQVSLVLVSSLDFTCINSVKLKIDIDGGIY